MKVRLIYILALLLLCCYACETEQFPNPETFDFELRPAPCVNGGTAFLVEIDKPEKYSYLWVLDGEKLGHSTTTDCLCGDSITVYVTRFKSSIDETLEVPTCDSEENK